MQSNSLPASEELFQSATGIIQLLDLTGEGIGVSDDNNRFVFINDGGKSLLGIPSEMILGHTLEEIFPGCVIQEVIPEHALTLPAKFHRYTCTFPTPEQTDRTLLVTTTPIPGGGCDAREFTVFRDITNGETTLRKLEESERKFKAVSDVMSDFISSALVTESGQLIHDWHNGPLERIIGHPIGSFNNPGFLFSIIHPDDIKKANESLHKCLFEGEATVNEIRVYTASGKEIWLEIFANPQYDSQAGRINKVIFAGRDITEKKQDELTRTVISHLFTTINLTSNLSELFERIRTSLQAIMDSRNLFIALFNPDMQSASMWYFKDNHPVSEEINTERTLIGYVKDHREPVLFSADDIRKMVLNGELRPDCTPARWWAGVPLIIGQDVVGVIGLPQYDHDPGILLSHLKTLDFIASNISLTILRRQSEEALRISEQNLRESNATKDKFFSILAHDLRSPFNAILGFAELLHEDYPHLDEKEKLTMIDNIFKAATGTFKLLENLLEWSRIQTGRSVPHPETTDISTIVNNCLSLLKPQAEKKNIKLFSGLHFGTSAFVDEKMITTVFRNLISNAIKFTNPGGYVKIFAEKNESFVDVVVSDNGVGIPPDNLSKLFRIDESVRTRGTAGEPGTGLGLILCREFTEINGGSIRAVSTPGEGSRFTVRLPLS